MPDTAAPSPSADSVTLHIEATPDRIYGIVSNVTQMGRLSPECTGGKWLGGATGPAVGARFKGYNKRGLARWSTTNEVVAADPGRSFAFQTRQSGTRWSYDLKPDGDGTLVTESRAEFKDRTVLAQIFTKLLLGGLAEHDDELREGMRATLDRLKAVAEAP